MTQIRVATFMGLGMLSGALPDGRPIVYYGGVVRIPKADVPDEQRDAFESFGEQAVAGLKALRSQRGDCEPIEGALMEISGCWETESGDVLLMWRVACLKTVAH
jgi:hypothetical protein